MVCALRDSGPRPPRGEWRRPVYTVKGETVHARLCSFQQRYRGNIVGPHDMGGGETVYACLSTLVTGAHFAVALTRSPWDIAAKRSIS